MSLARRGNLHIIRRAVVSDDAAARRGDGNLLARHLKVGILDASAVLVDMLSRGGARCEQEASICEAENRGVVVLNLACQCAGVVELDFILGV